MRWLLNNVRELNNEDDYLVRKIHLLRFLFVVVVSRNSSEENLLGIMNQLNLNKEPKNGELYCNTLLEIYPIFKEFIDEWGNQYALFRFCEAVGPNQYRGLLYEQ